MRAGVTRRVFASSNCSFTKMAGDLSLADRRGVYALLEKVSRGKDRLDFQKLSVDGKSGTWLLNINRMDAIPETGWPAFNGARQPQFFHTRGPNGLAQSPPNGQVAGTICHNNRTAI